MSLTISKYKNVSMTNPEARTQTFQIDFDTSYPAGGEAVDLSTYFPGGILDARAHPKSGYVFEIIETGSNTFANGKFQLKVFYSSAAGGIDEPMTEITAGEDLSSLTDVQVTVTGKFQVSP